MPQPSQVKQHLRVEVSPNTHARSHTDIKLTFENRAVRIRLDVPNHF